MDLKEFIRTNRWKHDWSKQEVIFGVGDNISIERLGLFFLERGGKQFVDFILTLKKLGSIRSEVDNVKIDWKELLTIAKDEIDETEDEKNADAQDFLDCLACLGEDKVKELINELK